MFSSMKFSIFLITVMSLSINSVFSQRSPYAGSRPNGYHDRLKPQTPTTEEIIVNRFGDDNSASQRPPVQGVPIVQGSPNFAQIIPAPTTTQTSVLINRINIDGSSNSDSSTSRIPYDAYNDHYLVDNYNRGPIDNRPFWLINQEHIERQRNLTSNQVSNFNPIAQPSSFAG